MENSEISKNHLKAIVGWRQVAAMDGFRGVPKCRHEKPRAKGKRRRPDLEAGSRGRWFEDAAYVLHAFQKESPKGIKTAQSDVGLVSRRLKAASEDYEARYGKRKK